MLAFVELKSSDSNVGDTPFIQFQFNVPGMPESPDQYCNLA